MVDEIAPQSLPARRYVQNAEVVGAEVSGETVLLHTATSACLEVDAIGARVWELLAEPHTLVSLTEALVREFEVDEAVCAANTEAFLQYLTELEFLKRADVA